MRGESSAGREFSHPVMRWLLKGWFLTAAAVFAWLLWNGVFRYPWFVALWIGFSLLLAWYVAPAIRVEPTEMLVKYLWRYRPIPWGHVLRVRRTALGAQIVTADSHPAYRVVSYQFPMPGIDRLVQAVEERTGRKRA